MNDLVDEPELETAQDMARALVAGEVRATELVERALHRAEAWQPATKAFSQLWGDQALDEARRIDRLHRDGLPPLAGIPVAVKELYDVGGHETTGCCRGYAGMIASADAPAVSRLRGAGA